MKEFRNATDKIMNFKVDGVWVVVNPNETIKLPSHADESRAGLVAVENSIIEEPKKKEIQPLKAEEELKKMTKDELNDYAFSIGLEEVKSSMKKAEMIKAILQA